ncbi:MAG: tetraacyldisaccharide 4'-kinase [Gemmatimonadaceae bacterium]
MIASVTRHVWVGTGVPARLARGVLYPLEAAYAAAVTVRRALYDRGVLRSFALPMPSVSVGNLTVGGTGKTPVSAWLVGQLASRGARPAIVLRDYGGDEGLVHAALNPGAPVITGADRVEAVRRARSAGADVVVLDDAFQHRRARRDADVVLVSADGWAASRRLLPAGPWREPLSSLGRASLIIVTRKAASASAVEDVFAAVGARAAHVPRALARLAPGAIVEAHGAIDRALGAIAGMSVLAVAGVADPAAFTRQLEALGARVTVRAYPDHYRFTASDAERLARHGARADFVVCTLKDAVKLAPVWPRGGPALWYLSQQVILERGRPDVERLIEEILEARARYSRTAG